MNKTITRLSLILIFGVNALQALELNFEGWKEFINRDEDGTKATAYTLSQKMDDIGISLTIHVHQRRSEFSMSQSITVGIDSKVLADVFIAYDKNGQYLKQVLVEKSEWLVSYGRFSGAGVHKEDECIIVREKTEGPRRGREVVFIRKNGIYMLLDEKVKDAAQF